MSEKITVSVPAEADRTALLAAPGLADLDVLVWDGTGERPERAERIELFVGRYNAPPPPAATFAGLPRLRVVQLITAGVEPWLPVVPDGVLLCNGRGIHGSSTAELAVAGLLSTLRGLPRYRQQQQDGRWQPHTSTGLAGASVLVLGAGDIGRRIGGIAALLDADVSYVARTARDGVHALDELPALLPRQQVVVLALPLTPETERLVDARFLAALPDDAVVVNVSRGGHVDTEALLAELDADRLRAVLDVTDPEPLPEGHPLWQAPNLVLTPHVGGGTTGWQERTHTLLAEQLRRYVAGDELVNQVSGY